MINAQNAKVFCYIKPFEVSPQRVEFHVNTYQNYKDFIDSVLDLIYYLLILQGDIKNPQVRSIAVAEKFARETIHLINLESIMKFSGLVPTMNQERFGW